MNQNQGTVSIKLNECDVRKVSALEKLGELINAGQISIDKIELLNKENDYN